MDQTQKEIRISEIIVKKFYLQEELILSEEQLLEDWLAASETNQDWFKEKVERLSKDDFEAIVHLSNQKSQWKRLARHIRYRTLLKKVVWSSVAALFLLAVGSIWCFFPNNKESVVYQKVQADVILPAEQKACLILSDGKKIGLTQQDTLVVMDQSTIQIHEGQVVYESKVVEKPVLEHHIAMVPQGGFYSFILSDGTRVFLNSETELRFPVVFSDDLREVELKGEAYFEVSPDENRPFVVRTDKIRTHVMGTTFNVMAYADEPEIKVTLLSGKVEVLVEGTDLKKTLKPGLQASWAEGGDIRVTKVDIGTQSLWKDGIIMLNEDELESVMRRLARWYQVKTIFVGPRKEKHTFTGKINTNQSLQHVLNTLTLMGGPNFLIKENTVYVYEK